MEPQGIDPHDRPPPDLEHALSAFLRAEKGWNCARVLKNRRGSGNEEKKKEAWNQLLTAKIALRDVVQSYLNIDYRLFTFSDKNMMRALVDARKFAEQQVTPQMQPDSVSPSYGMHGRDQMQVDPTERVIQETQSENPDVDVIMSDVGDMSTNNVERVMTSAIECTGNSHTMTISSAKVPAVPPAGHENNGGDDHTVQKTISSTKVPVVVNIGPPVEHENNEIDDNMLQKSISSAKLPAVVDIGPAAEHENDEMDDHDHPVVKTQDGLLSFSGKDVNFGATSPDVTRLSDTKLLAAEEDSKEAMDTEEHAAFVSGVIIQISRLNARTETISTCLKAARNKLQRRETAERRDEVNRYVREREEIKARIKVLTAQIPKGDALGIKKKAKYSEDLYHRMDEKEKEIYEEKGRAAIEAFLKTGNTEGLDYSIRRTIRDVASFLPQAGYSSRELALLVHENNMQNTQCRYHEHSKNRDKYDGIESSGLKIHGVAYQPGMNHDTHGSIKPEEGYMHCGCYIDDVLLDFFFWKTLTIQSRNPALHGIYESMTASELPPRIRAFMIQPFLTTSNLELNDLYAEDFGTPAYFIRRREVQTRNLLKLWDLPNNVPNPIRELLRVFLSDNSDESDPLNAIVAPTADILTDSRDDDGN